LKSHYPLVQQTFQISRSEMQHVLNNFLLITAEFKSSMHHFLSEDTLV